MCPMLGAHKLRCVAVHQRAFLEAVDFCSENCYVINLRPLFISDLVKNV